MYLSERQGCADGEVGGMGGTGILFTVAAFGLRMSWSHFFGGALEEFSSGEIVRNGAKHP